MNSQSEEIWQPIPNWDAHIASNKGRVAKILKPGDNRGYIVISLTDRDRTLYTTAHRLVAMTFIGPIPEGHQVHHLDGNKLNNVPENLIYKTPKEHYQETLKQLGHTPGAVGRKGEDVHTSKLTEDDVREIRRLHASGSIFYSELAAIYNVTKTNIWHIIKRKTWKHVD